MTTDNPIADAVADISRRVAAGEAVVISNSGAIDATTVVDGLLASLGVEVLLFAVGGACDRRGQSIEPSDPAEAMAWQRAAAAINRFAANNVYIRGLAR